MNRKTNKSLLLLCILSGSCFLIFLILFLVLVLVKGGGFGDILNVLKEGFSVNSFKELFAPSKGDIHIVFCIVNYIFISFAIFAIAFGTYVTIKSKNRFVILCIVIGVCALLPAYAFMVGARPIEDAPNEYRTFLFDTLFNSKFDSNKNSIAIIIITWFYLVFLVLSISLPLSTFTYCMLTEFKDNPKMNDGQETEDDEAEEAAILAEFDQKYGNNNTQETDDKVEEKIMEDKVESKVFVEEPEEFKEDEIAYSESELRSLIREIIKETVREELKNSAAIKDEINNVSQENQNNRGPIIVQYINGNPPINAEGQPTNSQAVPYGYPYPFPPYPFPYPYPQQQQNQQPNADPSKPEKPVENDGPKPVKKQPIEEVKNEVKKVESKEEKVINKNDKSNDEDESKDKIVRIPFYERILTVDKELQDLYSELKNELLSYGLKSRVAANGDTFRLHRKTYCRIAVAGKSLKLHLALDPNDYKDSKMPFSDSGNKATYAEIPLCFKVKSGLSLRRAKGLIADACAKDNLIQEDLLNIDWIKELESNKVDIE